MRNWSHGFIFDTDIDPRYSTPMVKRELPKI